MSATWDTWATPSYTLLLGTKALNRRRTRCISCRPYSYTWQAIYINTLILRLYELYTYKVSNNADHVDRKVNVSCSCISGPRNVELIEGGSAEFMWNNTCGKRIISATFGILKGNIADPQLINVDIINRKIYFNNEMGPKYKGRVNFTGNLALGHAWFELQNLTIGDCNWYIASISDKITRVLPYSVLLKIIPKENENATAPTTTSNASSSTCNKNASYAASSTPSIYTGAKKSTSTRNKISIVLLILIITLI